LSFAIFAGASQAGGVDHGDSETICAMVRPAAPIVGGRRARLT
jgi:hypothetical protein